MKPSEGRSRVVIETVQPEIDCGRHAAKRIVGDTMSVTAVIYSDGHDHLAARLLYKRTEEKTWRFVPFRELGNDVWEAEFPVDSIGAWCYTVQAWVDHFGTWVHDLHKRIEAQAVSGVQVAADVEVPGGPEQNEGVSAADEDTVAVQDAPAMVRRPNEGYSVTTKPQSDIALALRTGAIMLDQASARARDKDARTLKGNASTLRYLAEKNSVFYDFPLSDDIVQLCLCYPDLSFASMYARELPLWVDRERARFSSWYELFPRSAGFVPGKHGTLRDVAARLPEIAKIGFDIVYLPPIHPIGTAYRKGRNNSVVAEPGDVGSPWAIGNTDGGHKAILRELGNFSDFSLLLHCRGSSRTESKSRWTSPFSAHRSIPGSAIIRTGSRFARMARFNMRKIRPRNTRTSTPSTSNHPDWKRPVAGALLRLRLLDRKRCARLSCGQSTHKGPFFLEVVHRGGTQDAP